VISYEKYSDKQLAGIADYHRTLANHMDSRDMKTTAKHFLKVAETYDAELKKRRDASKVAKAGGVL
jgi:hypothetical protein